MYKDYSKFKPCGFLLGPAFFIIIIIIIIILEDINTFSQQGFIKIIKNDS